MKSARDRLLKTKLFLCCLSVLVLLGSAITVVGLKFHYDDRINELARRIEALQPEGSYDNDSLNIVTLAAGDGSLSVPEIAQMAGASVVGIKVTSQVRADMGRFGTQVFEQSSQGSGIIYNAGGYIITNYHVIENYIDSNSSQMEVFLADGRFATAEYIGGDKQNDLAVIRIELDGLPVARFGSSSSLRVGEFAMAIGNPLGMDLAGSITVGVISGIDRNVEAENVADRLIQTDAAINPGNSGGALVNGAGEVIGINTIKIASTEVEGIGFAIPVDHTLPVIDSIIEYGYVKDRPAIGISGKEIDAMTAQFYNVPQGILVAAVAEGSAAETAGIRINDIIVELDGETVSSMNTINEILKQHRAGDEVTIKYYRNGQTISAALTLMEDRGGSQ